MAGRVLAAAVPEHDEHLAAVPQPADLGRVRGIDLPHRLTDVLVRRPGPRPGDAPRPGEEPPHPPPLRHAGARLARLGAPLGALPACRRRWFFRSTRW
jgi:hypothetical protein